MGYKSLTGFVTTTDGLEAYLDAAAGLAERLDAHLEVCCLGIDPVQASDIYAGAPMVLARDTLAQTQAEAAALRDRVRAVLGVRNLRWSTEDTVLTFGGIAAQVGLKARFSDLVVLPRPREDRHAPQDEVITEAALFDGNAAVLVLPPGAGPQPAFRRVALAWNQSDEALHAARAALPFLKEAELVNVVIIDPPRRGQERSDPGGLLTTMLARHGVHAEVSVIAGTQPRTSDTLLRQVRDKDAGLLVIGAYSHSRLREAVLGGTTRRLLRESDTALFMMH